MILPQEILQKVFGFSAFRPLQEKIVNSLCNGRDNFVLMPTGGGKSLCYQIPAIARNGVGVVISPLISLMQNQVAALKANGVAAEFYNSASTSDEARSVLRDLRTGKLDLLYIAPERVISENFLQLLSEIPLALFAIDEAHCVSQWGPDFRPEYLRLNELREKFPEVPVIALTATADKETRRDIIKNLALEKADFHLGSFNRPNIRYLMVEKENPVQQLKKILESYKDQSGIVYCMTRKRVEEVAEDLQSLGIKAEPYHAGLAQNLRQATQNAFQYDDIQIIVATVAFGMGIDKPNVRFIVHYDMPKNIESYYQETGRAGRDGLPSDAILLFGWAEVAMMRKLIENNNNDFQRRIELHKMNAMVNFAQSQICRRRVLLNYFDEKCETDCGNCDICINPPATYDATVDAQKALSCVYRAGQRFGMMHLVDILRGAEKERLLKMRHNQLSTYGIGKHLSANAWSNLFRQLIHLNYLEQDIGNYSILKLTPEAWPLLRGEIKLILPEPRVEINEEKPATSKTAKAKKTLKAPSSDPALFQKLRTLRKQLADEAKLPPYIIFNDATLTEMSHFKPQDEEGFLAINGVGKKKWVAYGEVFMNMIKSYLTEKEEVTT